MTSEEVTATYMHVINELNKKKKTATYIMRYHSPLTINPPIKFLPRVRRYKALIGTHVHMYLCLSFGKCQMGD